MRAETLVDLIKSRNTEEGLALIAQQGGVHGVLASVESDPDKGIQSVSISERRERYGTNQVATLDRPSYLRLLIDACSDLTIMILAGAAVVSLVIALAYERTFTSYAEAIAILVSIAVVTNVAAINDWNKQRHFAKLYAEASRVMVRVLRDGVKREIDSKEIVVGDVVFLNVGEIVSADGLLLRGDRISMDESALTGEAKLVRKDVAGDLHVLAGTKVMEGQGSFLVLAVGEKSEAGEIQRLIQQEDVEKSVLTAKLDRVVILIGKLGLIVSISCFLIMIIRFWLFRFFIQSSTATCARIHNISSCSESPYPVCGESSSTPCCVMTEHGFMIEGTPCGWQDSHLSEILNFFITAVTILVVAVPEGLPLAVTLALAFAGRRMQKEQNLVKHLDACETMGSATTICSDKTATLTQNRMKVVRAELSSEVSALPQEVAELLAKAICLNSTADIRWNEKTKLYDQIGNKTECALLGFVKDQLGFNYEAVRIDHGKRIKAALPFSSEKKYSATLVDWGEGVGAHIFIKGASEVLLEICVGEVDAEGKCVALNETRRAILRHKIYDMAEQAMRTIVVAVKETPTTRLETDDISDLILVGIFGIEDPLREEVPSVIMQCRRAGIDVRMVTGDNIDTAVAIARSCNILRPEDLNDQKQPLPNRALTGPEFRRRVLNSDGEINQEAFDEVWPQLRVLARSSPVDKFTLVSGLVSSELYKTETGQRLGLYPDRQVVAVTGDGTNDAPALKKADVGLAMGITGTQVAKDAADIILLDDNFASIVSACKWGRNVYDAIAKFLQFQLTVNIVAITLAIIGSIAYSESPLRAVQMLWVNLIMDSIASLALATEPPTDALLNRPPYGRNKSIISPAMIWNIWGHSTYQLTVLIILFFAAPTIFSIPDGRNLDHKADPTEHYTLIFNTFVFMQLGNQINSRKLYHEWNMFDGILANKLFIGIELLEIVLQVIVTQFGGLWFRTTPLRSSLWFFSVAAGFGSLLVQLGIVAIARATTMHTRKPWLKEGLADNPESSEVLNTALVQVSSKLFSGIIGDIPREEEIRRNPGKPVGFRRNPTREFRDSRLFRK